MDVDTRTCHAIVVSSTVWGAAARATVPLVWRKQLRTTGEAANARRRLVAVHRSHRRSIAVNGANAGGGAEDIRAERNAATRPVSPRRPPPSSPLTRPALFAVSPKLRAAVPKAKPLLHTVCPACLCTSGQIECVRFRLAPDAANKGNERVAARRG